MLDASSGELQTKDTSVHAWVFLGQREGESDLLDTFSVYFVRCLPCLGYIRIYIIEHIPRDEARGLWELGPHMSKFRYAD